eukprot:g68498.t1
MSFLLSAENLTVFILTGTTCALLLADPKFWRRSLRLGGTARLRWRIHLFFTLAALFITLDWLMRPIHLDLKRRIRSETTLGQLTWLCIGVAFTQVVQKHLVTMHLLCGTKQPFLIRLLIPVILPFLYFASIVIGLLVFSISIKAYYILVFALPAAIAFTFVSLDVYEFIILRRGLRLTLSKRLAPVQRVRAGMFNLMFFHLFVVVANILLITLLCYTSVNSQLSEPLSVEPTAPDYAATASHSWTGNFINSYACPDFFKTCAYPHAATYVLWFGVSQLYADREVGGRQHVDEATPPTEKTANFCLFWAERVLGLFLPQYLRTRPPSAAWMQAQRRMLLVAIACCLVVLPALAGLLAPDITSLAVVLYSVVALLLCRYRTGGRVRHRKQELSKNEQEMTWAAQFGLKSAFVVYACVVCGSLRALGSKSKWSIFHMLSFVYMSLARYFGGRWWGNASVVAFICYQVFYLSLVHLDGGHGTRWLVLYVASMIVNVFFYIFAVVYYSTTTEGAAADLGLAGELGVVVPCPKQQQQQQQQQQQRQRQRQGRSSNNNNNNNNNDNDNNNNNNNDNDNNNNNNNNNSHDDINNDNNDDDNNNDNNDGVRYGSGGEKVAGRDGANMPRLVHVDLVASRDRRSISMEKIDEEKLKELIAYHGSTPLTKFKARLADEKAGRDDVNMLVRVDVDASRCRQSTNMDEIVEEQLKELIAYHGSTPLSMFKARLAEEKAGRDVLVHVDVDASRCRQSTNMDEIDEEKLKELIAYHGSTPLSMFKARLAEEKAGRDVLVHVDMDQESPKEAMTLSLPYPNKEKEPSE